MIKEKSDSMNLFSYVDKYGDKSFDEVSFNEVDNAVFSSLSYINFKGIVLDNRYNKITIRDASNKYFKLYPDNKKYILVVKQAVKLLRYIKDTKRYGDLYLYNYVYDAGVERQFSAVTIELNPRLVYVSFEGTDHLVSGWKEDFMMTYKFPIPSQRKAINYVNWRFLFDKKNIILGGHSKGGNLAMVSGMYANKFIKKRIIKVYNNDGPGLLMEQFETKNYASIENKLIHIVPNYAIVGLLLNHSDNYMVVRSSSRGVLSHDIHTWVVDDNSFMRAELDNYSVLLDSEINNWLDKYTIDERKRFLYAMFDIFEKANIESFMEILDNKRLILEIVNEYKGVNDIDKDMLKDFIGMLFNCFKEVKKDEFKEFFNKKKDELGV